MFTVPYERPVDLRHPSINQHRLADGIAIKLIFSRLYENLQALMAYDDQSKMHILLE